MLLASTINCFAQASIQLFNESASPDASTLWMSPTKSIPLLFPPLGVADSVDSHFTLLPHDSSVIPHGWYKNSRPNAFSRTLHFIKKETESESSVTSAYSYSYSADKVRFRSTGPLKMSSAIAFGKIMT
ncbi:hypothetical protein PoB_005903200 [Plakobranchus ocellatus]|uniref:Uncharacterized protein n=1 Tax=Plakobranchus ocellatus TaxID=259542 RepID=A0AAV4CLJ9_9GAST|nr:hypothetical protein PoB_005903200 [Plakobranchus ocellatus]